MWVSVFLRHKACHFIIVSISGLDVYLYQKTNGGPGLFFSCVYTVSTMDILYPIVKACFFWKPEIPTPPAEFDITQHSPWAKSTSTPDETVRAQSRYPITALVDCLCGLYCDLCQFAHVACSRSQHVQCECVEIYFSSCSCNRADFVSCNSLLSILALMMSHCDVKRNHFLLFKKRILCR